MKVKGVVLPRRWIACALCSALLALAPGQAGSQVLLLSEDFETSGSLEPQLRYPLGWISPLSYKTHVYNGSACLAIQASWKLMKVEVDLNLDAFPLGHTLGYFSKSLGIGKMVHYVDWGHTSIMPPLQGPNQSVGLTVVNVNPGTALSSLDQLCAKSMRLGFDTTGDGDVDTSGLIPSNQGPDGLFYPGTSADLELLYKGSPLKMTVNCPAAPTPSC